VVKTNEMPLPQGDLGLPESQTAKRLLASTVPARVACTGLDASPALAPARAREHCGLITRRTVVKRPLGPSGALA
jgi:hypothetical protein